LCQLEFGNSLDVYLCHGLMLYPVKKELYRAWRNQWTFPDYWTRSLLYVVKHVTGSISNIEIPSPLPMAQQPLLCQGLFLSRFHDHTHTHHPRQDSSGRVISPMQRPLLTTLNAHKRQASMPPAGSQQASGHRPTPKAAQPLGSAISSFKVTKYWGIGSLLKSWWSLVWRETQKFIMIFKVSSQGKYWPYLDGSSPNPYTLWNFWRTKFHGVESFSSHSREADSSSAEIEPRISSSYSQSFAAGHKH
jgi:hypothetical protein